MNFVIDIIIGLIILLCILNGARKGFMKIALSVAALLLAVYLSFNFSPVVAEKIQSKFIAPKIEASISKNLEAGSEKLEESIPKFVLSNMETLGIDFNKLFSTAENNKNYDEISSDFVDKNINPVMIKAITAVSAFIIFILLSIALGIVARMLNRFIKKSPIGPLNTAGGAILGIVNGLIFSAIFCIIISAVLYFNTDGFLFVTKANAESSYFYNMFTGLLF